jgi:hypothetical protein
MKNRKNMAGNGEDAQLGGGGRRGGGMNRGGMQGGGMGGMQGGMGHRGGMEEECSRCPV